MPGTTVCTPAGDEGALRAASALLSASRSFLMHACRSFIDFGPLTRMLHFFVLDAVSVSVDAFQPIAGPTTGARSTDASCRCGHTVGVRHLAGRGNTRGRSISAR